MGLVHQPVQAAGAIEQRILGVQVKMDKVSVRHICNLRFYIYLHQGLMQFRFVMNQINLFIRKARRLLQKQNLLNKNGQVLYSAAKTLKRGKFYILGLNPGGDAKHPKYGGQTISNNLNDLPQQPNKYPIASSSSRQWPKSTTGWPGVGRYCFGT